MNNRNPISSSNCIPRIIHYCWFGGGPKPDDIQECMNSWSILSDYQIIEWNESNCTFDENEYIRKAYAEKKWAFVADFYRLKALYELGGIYLDTDVKVYKNFDSLLHHKAFLNFIFDCSIGSAVIGAAPHNPLIGALLDMYEKTSFGTLSADKVIEERDGRFIIDHYVPNNYYFTYYILKHYPTFLLNNRFQDLSDFVIYPKEMFEIGSLLRNHYAIHICTGTWKPAKDSKGLNATIKRMLGRCPFLYDYLQIIVRKNRYRKLNKTIPFYPYYVAQRKHLPLPPL